MERSGSVSSLLRKHGITPRKSLGQNFLFSEYYLDKIVQAADVSADSSVLEIGPGLGSLTHFLAAKAGRVIAVELDPKLVEVLRSEFVEFGNVRIIHGDILTVPLEQLELPDGYLVVANIPYYITSAIIRRLLEAPVKPQQILLTIQREVADRVCAQPGEMSLLSLSVQVYGSPRKVLRIPAEAFYPSPNVDSSVLLIDLYPQPLIPAASMDSFFTLARAGFSQKRKTLRNALSGGLGWKPDKVEGMLAAAAIEVRRRAETLSIEEWDRLTAAFLMNS